MTDSNGEIVSVQEDAEGRPFFYISTGRAAALRQALRWIGLNDDPSNAGEIVLKDGLNPGDDGDEVVVFDKGADANDIQDALDELSWVGGRVVREVHP